MVDPVDNPVVGAIPQDPRNPHLVKAGRVFHEVYTSEDTYLATLQLVIDQKQALVQDSSFKALKASEKKVIFKLINIIEQLQKTETKLLEAFLTLDELMNASPQDAAQIQAQLKSIEPLMASSMRLHAKYMEVHAVEFFPFIRSKFKSVVALEFNKQVNVASAFIQPVQRGPRYPILLREAIEPLEKLQRETNTPVQYINEIIQMDEQIKTRLKGANAQINARPLKELRRRIYQGNIALPVMKDYVANLKKKEVKEDELSVKETNLENLESNVNASQDSIQKLKKEIKGLQREIDAISDDLKKMVKDHTKLPKVHSAYMELDNNAMKLSAGSPAIDWPTFVERAVSTEPKPAVETSGNIQISLDISKGERKAVKSRLRNLDPDIMQVLPQGFQVVETQKELGIRTGFLVKDQAGINVLHIVVEKGEVRIRELKSGAVSEDAKLMMMHRLSEALKYQESQSTIISTDVDKIRRLNEISVNEGLPTYAQASEEKRALHKKIVNEGQSRTTGIVLREIDIQCKGNLPEDIKEKVQEVISQGLFVPHLKTDDKSPLPLLSGEVTIATEVPLLAIKQYEAALNAGLTPVFTQDAKKKVESFVKKQMEINNSDTQVAVNVPFESHSITGAQVLERVKRASKDGFILNLNSQAKKNLKEHIANLKPDNPSLQYDLPMKHSHVAAMVNNLLALGLSPDTQAFPKAKMDELRKIMHKDAKDNNGLVFVDSGNIARDFAILQYGYTELGKRVDLEQKNTKAMLQYLKDKPLQHFDLKQLSDEEQLLCAQRLAQRGIHAIFTADIPPRQAIFIRSKNIDHAKEMFQSYLNQGFFPVGNKRIRELSEKNIPISISGLDPKVIWERMDHCAQSGLAIALTEEQIKIMKKFSEKHHPALPINGYGWDAVRHNIELANQLGMNIRGMTNHAQAAYLRAQAEAKRQGQPDIPRINIQPIYQTQSRFLRSDISVEDRARTIEFTNSLFKCGININMAGLEVMEAKIKAESEKKKWFGWSSKSTDSAKKAANFLRGEWQSMKDKVKVLTSQYLNADAANLKTTADNLSPLSVSKPKRPPLKRVNTLDQIPPDQIPAPKPKMVATQRQAFTPGAAAGAQVSVPPVVDASIAQAVSIAELQEAFKKIRDKAREDQQHGFTDTYKNPGRVFDNANLIYDRLRTIEREQKPDMQQQVQQLLKGLTLGDTKVVGRENSAIRAYVIDDSIKKVAQQFIDRLEPDNRPLSSPRGRIGS